MITTTTPIGQFSPAGEEVPVERNVTFVACFQINSIKMFWFYHTAVLYRILPFLGGWLADRLLGDPENAPHPVVFFGRLISGGEKSFNNGNERFLKGAIFALLLICGTYLLTWEILVKAGKYYYYSKPILIAVGVFYCLAGKTLITEVKEVFYALDRSMEEGRDRLSRIVGRDTSGLSPQEVRTAALETLAENLSDGVIAPMFWFAILGLPGMMAYKMINTLDSMIGYKNERYEEFGKAAAKIDDIANYIPARLTALFMLVVARQWDKRSFVYKYGPEHSSPNSGYPEAALAAILDCRFGGPNTYFGKVVDKPYIGTNNRLLTTNDMETAIKISNQTELLMGILVTLLLIWNFHL